MTGRERLGAVLRKKPRDRLPWTTLVDNATLSLVPEELPGNGGIDFYKHLGCEIFLLNGWNTPYTFRSPEHRWSEEEEPLAKPCFARGSEVMVLQGREVTDADIELIRALLAAHPARGRTPLSEERCRRWDGRNAQGRLTDMAARTLLLKRGRAGHIRLPARQRPSSNRLRNRRLPGAPLASEPIGAALRDLRPLSEFQRRHARERRCGLLPPT